MPIEYKWFSINSLAAAMRGPTPSVKGFSAFALDEATGMQSIYTDGGLDFPNNVTLRAGGLGFYIPQPLRALSEAMTSDFHSLTLGDADRMTTGIRWAHMAGQVATSTRAEVAAIAIALTVPAVLRIVTDSMAAFNRLSRYIALTDKQPRDFAVGAKVVIDTSEAWPTTVPPNSKDADLWSFIWHALKVRGPLSTAVAKIKSHLTKDQALQRGFSEADWIGNQNADVGASRGILCGADWRVSRFALIEKKSALSQKIVHAIQHMQVSIMRGQSAHEAPAHASLRFKPRREPTRIGPLGEKTSWPVAELRIWEAVIGGTRPGNAWTACIRPFVVERGWRDTGVQCIPWLLLMVIFETVMSVQVQLSDRLQHDPLRARASTKQLVECFRKRFTSAVKTFLHPDCLHPFTSKSCGAHVLKGISFHGFTACIAGCPILTDTQWSEVTMNILAIKPKLPSQWRDSFQKGLLVLPMTQLSMLCPPRWRKGGLKPEVVVSGHTSASQFMIRCPGCPSVIALMRKPQREATSWPKVKCASCLWYGRCGVVFVSRAIGLLLAAYASHVMQPELRAGKRPC